ncbi:hypothetical protein HY024_03880 [Candidatus Curtissbacteria bacterium]|nr:hypothetical protein [Candidatus Curtissbacteria bacterium]
MAERHRGQEGTTSTSRKISNGQRSRRDTGTWNGNLDIARTEAQKVGERTMTVFLRMFPPTSQLIKAEPYTVGSASTILY